MREITITQENNRYVVEYPEGKLHILNEFSLRWNLKNVFGLTGEQAKEVVVRLMETGVVTLTWRKAS